VRSTQSISFGTGSSYSDYWQKKIRRNIARDEKVKEYYKNIGWTILRFWTSETEANLNKCIIETINKIKNHTKKTKT
jgi:G:T-mismatch repair DNA endonuclease (very short patch repair protein)